MPYNPQQSSRGGYYSFTQYSGNGALGDVAISLSGQNRGRLNSVMVFNQTSIGVSGVSFTIYDGANVGVTLASGGPIVGSGHVQLFTLPAWPNQGALSGAIAGYSAPFNVDQPFFSGLNVAARSGGPGFTATWTVEKPVY